MKRLIVVVVLSLGFGMPVPSSYAQSPASLPAPRVGFGFLVEANPAPVVVSVRPDGAAARAGLAVGDTIIRVDGEPATLEAISHQTFVLSPGARLPLTIRRGGRQLVITLVAAEVMPARAPTMVNRDSVSARAG